MGLYHCYRFSIVYTTLYRYMLHSLLFLCLIALENFFVVLLGRRVESVATLEDIDLWLQLAWFALLGHIPYLVRFL